MGTLLGNINFFIECFNQYWGNRFIIPILLICSLTYIAIRKNLIWKKGILYPTLFSILTIGNPFIMTPVLEKTGYYSRYYRFYWIVPVVLIIMLAFADLILKIKSKIKISLCIIIFLCFIMNGQSHIAFGIENWNIYKIDKNVLEISRIIHSDTSKESPVVLVDTTLIPSIRQFDPSLISAIELTEYLSPGIDQEYMYNRNKNHGDYLALISNFNEEVDPILVRGKLIEVGVDYYVRNKSWFSDEYIKNLGQLKIGETASYEVYRIVDTN